MAITFNRTCPLCGTTYFEFDAYNNHSCVVNKKVIKAKIENKKIEDQYDSTIQKIKEQAKSIPPSSTGTELKTDEEKKTEMETSRMKLELNAAGKSANTLNSEDTRKMYLQYESEMKAKREKQIQSAKQGGK